MCIRDRLNTLGAVLGYACYVIFTKLVHRLKLKPFVDKLIITSTATPWKKSVIPVSLMLIVSVVMSVYTYIDGTVSADLDVYKRQIIKLFHQENT